MEGQTSFINPLLARERDLSMVRMPEGTLFVDTFLAAAGDRDPEEATPTPETAAGQLALNIGELGLSTSLEAPLQ